ncbi:MAG: YitT family protein, partial [Clostridia bacterium]|nr:YitT family protein [Clostridia bacterium]
MKKSIIQYLGTILGAAIMAAGVSFFLLPNQLSSGGFSGLATIAYYLFNFPMGIVILCLNAPLFIIS